MSDSANIARHLPLMAAQQPAHPALKVPRGRAPDGSIDYLSLTFAELDREVDAWCALLQKSGVRRGDRTLIMVKQGLPLIAAVFALFKLGAVPIVIDPGMGLKSFLQCVARSKPRVILGIPLARIISRVFSRTFSTVKIRIAASNSPTKQLSLSGQSNPLDYFTPVTVAANELAAILFTSGSTGEPKGVCYEHGMFEAQVRMIRDHYDIKPGEVDLPMLPIFALFNPALGMTTVVPEIDPRRPAEVDPAKIVQAIIQESVTTSFGSPTLWLKIQQHCLNHNIQLPSLRRVLCAGAPVPAELWQDPRRWLPNGTLHSPYGATESLPVSSISAIEIEPNNLRGACVGRPLSGMEVKIISLTSSDAAISDVPRGEIGEIIVHGPVVTKTYDSLPQATAAAKITDGNITWHRMGDCGYLDASGQLWFVGRKIERVQTTTGTLFTEPCEQVFRAHPKITRCALIGLGSPGQQMPALVVEAVPRNTAEKRRLARELHQLALGHPDTTAINLFFFIERLPVDVRHNAKIHRLSLAQWATTAKGYESDHHR